MIPLGISDWRTLRREEYFYVDKTHYIEKLPQKACLWGNRRTGKSLFCSQLELYHDKAVSSEEVIFL